MFFEHDHVNSRSRQQISEHHAGWTSADNTATRLESRAQGFQYRSRNNT
jgi:hypothetical protein